MYPLWGFKDIIKTIFLSLIVTFILSALLSIALIFLGIPNNFIIGVIEKLIFFSVIVIFIYLNIVKKCNESFLASLKIQVPKNFNLFFVIPITFFVWLITELFPGSRAVEPPLVKILSSNVNYYLCFVVMGLIISPFFEEILWRGYIYPVFRNRLGVFAAIFSVTLLFTLTHVAQLWGAWQFILYNLMISLTLTILRELTDSTLTSLLAHLSYNIIITIAEALKFFHII